MTRFHGLDACRAAAMMLGLFFHGAISFMDTRFPWAIRDRSTSYAVDVFVWICHSFRMPVFFLLAGFFGRLVHEKLGTAGFLRHRARRILLPLAVTLVPLMPTLYFLWRWGASRQPLPAAGLHLQDASIDPSRMIAPGHLWFLYYLLIILAGLVAMVVLARRIPLDPLRRGADRLLRVLVRFRLVAFGMAIPTAATLHPMISMSSDTPADFIPQPRILLYYFVFTAFGWLLHRQADLVAEFGRRLWIPLLVALAAIAPVGLVVERTVVHGSAVPPALRAGALYLSALFGWSLVVLFLGAFVKWGERPRPWVAYLSDASYWCYLVHLPIVVALQILVADLAWPGPVKYALLMAATIAVCLGSYHAFVRYTFVGASLNGPRGAPVTP